ncbi:MAG: glutamate--tRNA ligase family protein [Kiritimatiellia bacterium]
MGITEVVRGEDLLKSTARQLLLYEALGAPPPAFYHTPLVRDANGVRLAKRTDALAMKTWRERGCGFAEALGAVSDPRPQPDRRRWPQPANSSAVFACAARKQ